MKVGEWRGQGERIIEAYFNGLMYLSMMFSMRLKCLNKTNYTIWTLIERTKERSTIVHKWEKRGGEEQKWRLMINFGIHSDWKEEERRTSMKPWCYSKNIRSPFAAEQKEWNTTDAIINQRKERFFFSPSICSRVQILVLLRFFFKQNSNLDSSYATSTSYSIKLTGNDDVIRSKE